MKSIYLLTEIEGIISLKIHSGKLVDESIETWLQGFSFYLQQN
jgi:hypothetical protein